MNQHEEVLNIEKQQFLHQTNLVYYGTVGMALFLIPYMAVIGNLFVVLLNVLGLLVSVIAIVLNRREHYLLASLIFLVTITFNSSAHAVVFGLRAGFGYFFLNQAGLIVYTNWRNSWKLLGVTIQFSALVGVFVFYQTQGPLIELSYGHLIFLHALNGSLNIIGVANSANYFLRIAGRSNQTLATLAYTDYLTGLPNRTALEGLLNEAFDEQNTKAKGIGIMMIDVDHFKLINDEYGHVFGDQVLKHVADTLKAHPSLEQIIARYGGEEFIVITFCDTPQCVYDKAEATRKRIEASKIHVSDTNIGVTVSIGTVFKPVGYRIEQLTLLDMADACLYQAKRSGRNNVVSKVLGQ